MMKVEYDPYVKKSIPRKYFAGGVDVTNFGKGAGGAYKETKNPGACSALLNELKLATIILVTAGFSLFNQGSFAQKLDPIGHPVEMILPPPPELNNKIIEIDPNFIKIPKEIKKIDREENKKRKKKGEPPLEKIDPGKLTPLPKQKKIFRPKEFLIRAILALTKDEEEKEARVSSGIVVEAWDPETMPQEELVKVMLELEQECYFSYEQLDEEDIERFLGSYVNSKVVLARNQKGEIVGFGLYTLNEKYFEDDEEKVAVLHRVTVILDEREKDAEAKILDSIIADVSAQGKDELFYSPDGDENFSWIEQYVFVKENISFEIDLRGKEKFVINKQSVPDLGGEKENVPRDGLKGFLKKLAVISAFAKAMGFESEEEGIDAKSEIAPTPRAKDFQDQMNIIRENGMFVKKGDFRSYYDRLLELKKITQIGKSGDSLKKWEISFPRVSPKGVISDSFDKTMIIMNGDQPIAAEEFINRIKSEDFELLLEGLTRQDLEGQFLGKRKIQDVINNYSAARQYLESTGGSEEIKSLINWYQRSPFFILAKNNDYDYLNETAQDLIASILMDLLEWHRSSLLQDQTDRVIKALGRRYTTSEDLFGYFVPEEGKDPGSLSQRFFRAAYSNTGGASSVLTSEQKFDLAQDFIQKMVRKMTEYNVPAGTQFAYIDVKFYWQGQLLDFRRFKFERFMNASQKEIESGQVIDKFKDAFQYQSPPVAYFDNVTSAEVSFVEKEGDKEDVWLSASLPFGNEPAKPATVNKIGKGYLEKITNHLKTFFDNATVEIYNIEDRTSQSQIIFYFKLMVQENKVKADGTEDLYGHFVMTIDPSGKTAPQFHLDREGHKKTKSEKWTNAADEQLPAGLMALMRKAVASSGSIVDSSVNSNLPIAIRIGSQNYPLTFSGPDDLPSVSSHFLKVINEGDYAYIRDSEEDLIFSMLNKWSSSPKKDRKSLMKQLTLSEFQDFDLGQLRYQSQDLDDFKVRNELEKMIIRDRYNLKHPPILVLKLSSGYYLLDGFSRVYVALTKTAKKTLPAIIVEFNSHSPKESEEAAEYAFNISNTTPIENIKEAALSYQVNPDLLYKYVVHSYAWTRFSPELAQRNNNVIGQFDNKTAALYLEEKTKLLRELKGSGDKRRIVRSLSSLNPQRTGPVVEISFEAAKTLSRILIASKDNFLYSLATDFASEEYNKESSHGSRTKIAYKLCNIYYDYGQYELAIQWAQTSQALGEEMGHDSIPKEVNWAYEIERLASQHIRDEEEGIEIQIGEVTVKAKKGSSGKAGSALTTDTYNNIKKNLDGKRIMTPSGESYRLFVDSPDIKDRIDEHDPDITTEVFLIDENGNKSKTPAISFRIYRHNNIDQFESFLSAITFTEDSVPLSQTGQAGFEELISRMIEGHGEPRSGYEDLSDGLVARQLMTYLLEGLPEGCQITGPLEAYMVGDDAGWIKPVFYDQASGLYKKEKEDGVGYDFIIDSETERARADLLRNPSDRILTFSQLASLVVFSDPYFADQKFGMDFLWEVWDFENMRLATRFAGKDALKHLVEYQKKQNAYIEQQLSQGVDEAETEPFFFKDKNGKILNVNLSFVIKKEKKISSSLASVVDREKLEAYRLWKNDEVRAKTVFVDRFERFSNVTPDTLGQVINFVKGKDKLAPGEVRDIDRFKEAVSVIEKRKYELLKNWNLWEGFECSIFNERIVIKTLEELGIPYQKVIYKDFVSPNRISFSNHHYVVVDIAGEKFIIDTTADQFEVKASHNNYHPYVYYDLGVVLLPLKEVNQDPKHFWMYQASEKSTGDMALSSSLQSDAQGSNSQEAMTPGGIDFNAKNMNVNIKGEGARDLRVVGLKENQNPSNPLFLNSSSPILSDNIEGLTPVIINIVPVTNLYNLLGLLPEEDFEPQTSPIAQGTSNPAKELAEIKS